jgi:hypothetical protein
VLSGYITTLKNKQKLDVSSEGPSSRVSVSISVIIVIIVIVKYYLHWTTTFEISHPPDNISPIFHWIYGNLSYDVI